MARKWPDNPAGGAAEPGCLHGYLGLCLKPFSQFHKGVLTLSILDPRLEGTDLHLDTDSEGQVLCGLLSPIQAFRGNAKPTTHRAGSPWTVAGEVAEVRCPRTKAEVYQPFHIHLTKMYLKSQPNTFAVVHGSKSV